MCKATHPRTETRSQASLERRSNRKNKNRKNGETKGGGEEHLNEGPNTKNYRWGKALAT